MGTLRGSRKALKVDVMRSKRHRCFAHVSTCGIWDQSKLAQFSSMGVKGFGVGVLTLGFWVFKLMAALGFTLHIKTFRPRV